MDAANSDNSLKNYIFLHNKGKIELTHFHKTSEDILFKQQWVVYILWCLPWRRNAPALLIPVMILKETFQIKNVAMTHLFIFLL